MVDFDAFFKNFCDSVDALPEIGYLIARDNNDEEIENIVNEWQEFGDAGKIDIIENIRNM